MPHSQPPSPTDAEQVYVQEVKDLIASLSADPDKEPIASEIEVLQSIYGDAALRIYHPPGNQNGNSKKGAIRFEVTLNLPSPHDGVSIKILVSLPPTYPASSSPQLQLLSRYIGAYGADSHLFGSILRTYISVSGVEWSEDSLCVFDGLQNVLERCVVWYEEHMSLEKAGQLIRDDSKENTSTDTPDASRTASTRDVARFDSGSTIPNHDSPSISIPPGIYIHVAEPIQDRKSTFVGRACRISDPSEVPLIIAYVVSDRRISRAAHPVIHAWRCRVGNVLHQDNDDDGETAAGGRLAHLLQILEADNVLVIVTRYFGGIHLGPDRFKHINQAARNALDVGSFLDTHENKVHVGRGKKH